MVRCFPARRQNPGRGSDNRLTSCFSINSKARHTMRKSFALSGATLLAAASWAAIVPAQDTAKADAKKSTSATYVMTGLHCPPCTQVVEKSLSAAPGVKSIKVDWETKNAKVE